MKLIAAATLSALLAQAFIAHAEEPPVISRLGGAWKLYAECRMVTLSQKAALPLIAQFSEPDTVNEAWDHLARMLENGQAALEANLIVQGAEETKLTSQTLEELKYPTEFNPAEFPPRISAKAAPDALKIWPIIGVTPTAFGVREIGETLEFQGRVLEGGAWLAVSVEAMHTRLHDWAKFDYAELPGGERLALGQPQCSVLKNNSSFRLRNGERILFGVHKLAKPEKTFELFVLQVKAIRVGARP